MDFSIFKDLEISNPQCKDKIKLLLEEIQDEDDQFMEILIDLKPRMRVTWVQPWYQKTGCLTRKLEQKENESEHFRSGKITKAECELIHRNWLKLVKKFELPNEPICLARWRSKGKKDPNKEFVRHFVIMYISRHLKRNLHQVFQHFVACYAGHNRGQYTEQEVKIIQICMYHFPTNAIQYSARLLSREARGIQKRVNEKFKDKREKKQNVKWNLASASKFLKLLIQYSCLSLEKLKYKKIKRDIWVKLESDMNKTVLTLQKFWFYYLHVQIFVKCDVRINKLRKKLIELIRNSPYEVWSDICWQELVTHFPDGVTAGFLYNISVKIAVLYKNYLHAPLEDVLTFMLGKINRYPEKRLRTFVLNSNGTLEAISYKRRKDEMLMEVEQ